MQNTVLGSSGVDVDPDIDTGVEGIPVANTGAEPPPVPAVSGVADEGEGASSADHAPEKEAVVPESQYKNAERKITELAQQNAELRGRQAVLDELREQQATTAQPQQDPWAWLDDPSLKERFEDDPWGTWSSSQEKMMRQIGQLVQDQHELHQRELSELRPERIAAKQAMAELRGQEWFEAIPSEQREGAAMAYLKLKSQMNGGQAPPAPPGGMGGGTSPGRAPKKAVPMQDDPRFQGILQRMGGLKAGNDSATLLGGR
jgi:hypothetical protein